MPLLLLLSCAGQQEQAARRELARVSARRGHTAEARGGDAAAALPEDGRLAGYVAYALGRHPELEASYQRWRAAALRIAPARALPEPTLSYSYYLRQVETRVGPQRHRLGLRQMFPWPGRLAAAAETQSFAARAAAQRFEAAALHVQRSVAEAYWALWRLERTAAIQRDQLVLLQGLAAVVRARLEAGEASLADLNQVNLKASRLEDRIAGLVEAQRSARAHLRAALGAPEAAPLPIAGTPPATGLPAAEPEALRTMALAHPQVDAQLQMARASAAAAEQERARRLPSFGVGVDWIETGEARMPNVQDSGKDAWMLNLSVDVPLWWGAYADGARAARAEERAHVAEAQALRDGLDAQLQQTLASLRDAQRRVQLYLSTLVPQAEATYRSMLGAYQAARADIAAMLEAQRDLLELQVELAAARTDHASAWARLEALVGREIERREVERREVEPENDDD